MAEIISVNCVDHSKLFLPGIHPQVQRRSSRAALAVVLNSARSIEEETMASRTSENFASSILVKLRLFTNCFQAFGCCWYSRITSFENRFLVWCIRSSNIEEVWDDILNPTGPCDVHSNVAEGVVSLCLLWIRKCDPFAIYRESQKWESVLECNIFIVEFCWKRPVIINSFHGVGEIHRSGPWSHALVKPYVISP